MAPRGTERRKTRASKTNCRAVMEWSNDAITRTIKKEVAPHVEHSRLQDDGKTEGNAVKLHRKWPLRRRCQRRRRCRRCLGVTVTVVVES